MTIHNADGQTEGYLAISPTNPQSILMERMNEQLAEIDNLFKEQLRKLHQ